VHLLWVKTELLHPIDKGGRIRTYNMLRALKRQHRVTYVALDNGGGAPDAVERAQEYCHDLIRVEFSEARRRSPRFWLELAANLVSPLPYAVAKYRSLRMELEIRQAVSRLGIDLLVCDFLFPSQNVPDGLQVPTVLFQHNVEAAIWRRHADVRVNPLSRAYFREQWRRMRQFEERECRRFGHVVAVSEADARAIETEYGIAGVSDVPTGVDTEYFHPRDRAPLEARNLVFTGAMDWMPNEDGIAWFVDDVLPLIHAQMPDVTLTIVGRNPPPRIQALSAQDQRLRVTGSVPDVRPYMEAGSVFVVPLRVGGGTRLKIYEALAMERPLVSTTIGAEGLPLEHGVHALIADGAKPFADAVVGLLSDPRQASAMALSGATYVRANFGWDRAVEKFVNRIAGSASEATPPAPVTGTRR
jgi:sugar transferase (PEP-CTERM/EpsH1 system associated)